MFKRPPAVKTSAPVRSSDVRRLRDEVQQAFALPQDRVKKLVPDGTLAAKATTHLDEHCTLYLAPTSTDCRLFRVGKGTDGYLVPTCYACDLVPDLLPVLETAPQVVDHLVSGSALFAAGVSPRSLAALPNAIQPGALVAVVVAQDPPSRRVVAVGHLGATKSDLIRMQQSDGEKKGKAVVTLHARGDFLWNAGSGIDAPLPPASRGSTSPAAPAEADALAADLASSSLDTPAAEPSPSASSSGTTAELTPAEVDSALFTALLVALSTTLPSASLPLPASLLYSSHILPCRPSSGPGAAAEVKKSTFKKLDRFVRAAAKKGWIATKEVKGEIVVVGVNAAHPDVESVRGYRTQGMEERKEARREKAAEGGAGAESVEGKGGAGAGEVRELWKLSGESVKELIRSVEHERPPNDLYPTSLLSSLLRTFTTTHSLSHPSQRSLLLLTPSAHPSPPSLSPAQTQAIDLLSRVVLRKGERAKEVGSERGAPGCVGREEALRRVLAGCTAYWGYSRKGGEELIKKGSPPTIRVAIKNVGKRQVTLVSGHEPWELFTSEDLAEELKHRSASSTSIQPLAGSAKKGHTPKVEIMCQGTHDALVVKLLVARGVPRTYVEDGAEKNDVKVPDNEIGQQIEEAFDNGEDLIVTITSAMGEEHCLGFKPAPKS
ncbi:hypothetical protein JCM10450v2_007377 [Rhodotorula kratochvilovae]